ncbi:MAG: undecaprenyl-diphosphate phosphatase [Burkholderiales bacterium]|jgi:undecaprenyl-diphosphatase|nr:undecaprenyl-diphosphate phosphatase [Burkholderiales bacterium]
MTLDLFFIAFILGLVEGLTEFLPISSTGHLILAGSLLGYGEDDNSKTFYVVIQLGAIFAVCWEYRQRLWKLCTTLLYARASQKLALNLIIALLPAVVLGALLYSLLRDHLFAPIPVACALIIGGFIILLTERRYKSRPETVRIQTIDDIGWQDALKVGFAQAVAMIPGTSRSGATIIGGMLFGFSRIAATEFSFLLAIPTMFAATFYSLYKDGQIFSSGDLISFLSVGFITAFISAFFCVRWLLRYISHHDFLPFAWYRIGFGLLILVTSGTGIIVW